MNTAFNLRRIPLKYTQTRRYLLKFSPLARLTLLIIFSSSCTASQHNKDTYLAAAAGNGISSLAPVINDDDGE